uniref:HECT-type E3 ubiquitin transferase n=1 Tax=Amorphochlora amoebiformis TaxID=1561963 RepID=A0A7S0CYA6_9EUKA|mmetsp:Transcript_15747/g.24921  ORF Transcript_15747/g.24921 Transcript_15747/m.24921 type:complete len:4076 (+) Transcript_15747:76-12303(+)
MISRFSSESFLAAEVALPILLDHFSSDDSYRKTGNKYLQWEWQDNDSWRPYPVHLNARLEQARRNNRSTVYFCLGGQKYELDFTALHQRNTNTGRVRKIRFKSTAKLSGGREDDSMAFNWSSLSRLLTDIGKERAINERHGASKGDLKLSERLNSKITETTKALRESLKVPPDALNDNNEDGKRVVETLSKLLATHVRPCTIAANALSFDKAGVAEVKTDDFTPDQLSWSLSCATLQHFWENGVSDSFWKTISKIISEKYKPLSVIPRNQEENHYYRLLTKLCLQYAQDKIRKGNRKEFVPIVQSVLSLLLGQGSPECHLHAIDMMIEHKDTLPVGKIIRDWREAMTRECHQALRAKWDWHLFRPPVTGSKEESENNLPEVHCCSDGTYIYVISSRWGLIKIGTGAGGTVCGQVVGHNQSMWIHGEGYVTYVADLAWGYHLKKGFLALRTVYLPDRLLLVDPESLLLMGHVINLKQKMPVLEDTNEEERDCFNITPIAPFTKEKPRVGMYVDARNRGEWSAAQIISLQDKDTVKLHFDNPNYSDKNNLMCDIAPFGTHISYLTYLCAIRPEGAELDLTHESIYKANFSEKTPWLTPYVRKQVFDRIICANWTPGSTVLVPEGGQIKFLNHGVIYVDEKGKETPCAFASGLTVKPVFYDPIKSEFLLVQKRKTKCVEDTWIVVTKAGLNIRRGPNVDSPKVRDDDWLRPNERVVGLEVNNDWLRHSRGWSCIHKGVKRYMKQIRPTSLYVDIHHLSAGHKSKILGGPRLNKVCENMVVAQQLREYDKETKKSTQDDINKFLKKVHNDMIARPISGYIVDEKALDHLSSVGKCASSVFLQQLGFHLHKDNKLEIDASKCARDMILEFLKKYPYWSKKYDPSEELECPKDKDVRLELSHVAPSKNHCSSTGVHASEDIDVYKCVHPHCDTHVSKFAIMNRSFAKTLGSRSRKKQFEVGFPIVKEEVFNQEKRRDSKNHDLTWEAATFPCEQTAMCFYDWRRGHIVFLGPHKEMSGRCMASILSIKTGKRLSAVQLKTNAVSLCFSPEPTNCTEATVWGISFTTSGTIGTYLLESWSCPYTTLPSKIPDNMTNEKAVEAILDGMPCLETGKYLWQSIERVCKLIGRLASEASSKEKATSVLRSSPVVAAAVLRLLVRYVCALTNDIETEHPSMRKRYADLFKSVQKDIQKLPGSGSRKQRASYVEFLAELFPLLYPTWDMRVQRVVELYKENTDFSKEIIESLTESYRQIYAGITNPGILMTKGLCDMDYGLLTPSEKTQSNIDFLHAVVRESSLEKKGVHKRANPSLASLTLLTLMQQFHHLSCTFMGNDAVFAVHKLLQLEKGDEVDVLDQSNWRPAEIVDKKEEKSYLVHYIGFDSKYDEWHTVGSGNIATRGTKCRWRDRPLRKEQDLETLKRKASKAARTLFKLSTSVLSMCVTIVDDFIRECKDKMKKAKTAKMKSKPDETPKMPNHSSDLLLFSMFCIVRVGFDNGKEQTFHLMRSCFDLLKHGLREPKLLTRELHIVKRLLRYVLEYLFHNPVANHRVFGTDIMQKDLVAKLLPVLDLKPHQGMDVIDFLNKFIECAKSGSYIAESEDYKSLTPASRLSVFFEYCVSQHSRVSGDGFCPVDLKFARGAEKSFAAAALRLSANEINTSGRHISLAKLAIEFATSDRLLRLMNTCRQKSYRFIIFAHGQNGLPPWFRTLVAMTYVHIRKPVITALNSHSDTKEKITNGDPKDNKDAKASKNTNTKKSTQTGSESKVPDSKQKSTPSSPIPTCKIDPAIPKHVITMVFKWYRNSRFLTSKFDFKTTEIVGNSSNNVGSIVKLSRFKSMPHSDTKNKRVFCNRVPTLNPVPSAGMSSAQEDKKSTNAQMEVEPQFQIKCLENSLKWLNNFIKSAEGLNAEKVMQWAMHAESTFNGRLMFLRSVATFNMQGGENATVVMIDEVFPNIWAALKNSEHVKIFQPLYEGQITVGGIRILCNFFKTIAAVISSYVDMKPKDLPQTEVLRFRMYILLPFISSDVSHRGVQMFLDSGIALALCRFALNPNINKHHTTVAAMAWRSFVHLIVIFVSKSSVEDTKSREHLDKIVDVLQTQMHNDVKILQAKPTFENIPLTVGARQRAFVDSLKKNDIIDARTYGGDWRIAKVVRVKPSSVLVTWRGWVKETNEHIFKDSGRLAPFNSRAPLELPKRDPDFHAPAFELVEKNLRRADAELSKAFGMSNGVERREMSKYQMLNFRLFRTLDVLKILSSVAHKSDKLCDFVITTLVDSVRKADKVLSGVLQLELVRFLQTHLPSYQKDTSRICQQIFRLYSFLAGGSLPMVEKLSFKESDIVEEAVKDITEEVSSRQKKEKKEEPNRVEINMEQRWTCCSCLKDNPGKMHACAHCFVPREISQPEFAIYLKEQKEKEKKRAQLAKRLKEEEQKRLKLQKEKLRRIEEERKKKKEEGKRDDGDTIRSHIVQSWTESGARNSSNRLLIWSINDLVRNLLECKNWEREILDQIRSGISAIPANVHTLLGLSSKFEHKVAENTSQLLEEAKWKDISDAMTSIHMMGGFGGEVHEGSYVEVTLSHQLVRRGWVKQSSPKLIVELFDPTDRTQSQEVVCNRKDVTPVAILSPKTTAEIFGSNHVEQRKKIELLLSSARKCLEESTLNHSSRASKSAGFLLKVCAQQLTVGLINILCKLFLDNFTHPQQKLPCDFTLLLPLFIFAKSKPTASYLDTSSSLPIHWNELLELGMRTKEEYMFESNVEASAYLIAPETALGISDAKTEKPLILQHVDTLCNLGFTRDAAKGALAASNGDLGRAGHMLTDNNSVVERDSSSAWKSCLRRLDAVDAVTAWERRTQKESSMNSGKWKGKPGKATAHEIHMGSDVLGKESDSDSAFTWAKDRLENPVGLVVKFRHVDNPVRHRRFQLGQRVRAQDMHHEWYDAEIIEVKGDWVKLHYDKFDHFWDEWIEVKKQWRKLQIPGSKRLNESVRTVDHNLPFELKAGVLWKVSKDDANLALIKFPGDGFKPSHYIWSDIHDLEPFISTSAKDVTCSLPGEQLAPCILSLNATQLSHSLAILQQTIKKSLLSHVGVSLSVLPGLRKLRLTAVDTIHLLSCQSNPWNWGDNSDCSSISEPAKLLVQEVARAIGVGVLQETIEQGDPTLERVLKKKKEELDEDPKLVKAKLEGGSKPSSTSGSDTSNQNSPTPHPVTNKDKWKRFMAMFESTVSKEIKELETTCKECILDVRCLANGAYYLAPPQGGFSKTMVAFDRNYGGSPMIHFYSDKERSRMLKKVSGSVPSPFAMRVPVYITVDQCSQEEGLNFLRRMVSFTPLQCNSLDVLYVMVEVILFLLSHPWIKKDVVKVGSLQHLMIRVLTSLVSIHKSMWGSEDAMPSLLKMQMLEMNSKMIIYQLKHRTVPGVFKEYIKSLTSSCMIENILNETALRFDVEIGENKASKEPLLSGRNNAKLSKLLLRSHYLLKHVEFLTCVWEYLKKFDAPSFEKLIKKYQKEEPKKKGSDTPAKSAPAAAKSQDPWSCSVCTFTNSPARTCCEMCNAQRESTKPNKPEKDSKPTDEKKNSKKIEQLTSTIVHLQKILTTKPITDSKDSKQADNTETDNMTVESICLLDLSLNSVWWPLFSNRVVRDLRLAHEKPPHIILEHEYSLAPLTPLAALLFKKETRLKLFDTIISCSTVQNRKLPDITVDTSNIIGPEKRSGSGLFGQIKKQFKRLSSHQLRGKLGEYSWATRWKGGRNVGSEGLPGPFQQSMGMIWTELNERAQRRDMSSPVILCPNGEAEMGDKDRDNLLLNPGLKSPSSFRCLGQLLGCVLRSSSNCSLPFSRTMWRALVYGHYHVIRRGFFEKMGELETFDKNQSRQLLRIITSSEHDFKEAGYTYSTSMSDKRIIELFPGGQNQVVEYEDRLSYVELVVNARLEENANQTDVVRQGFLSVIPRYTQQRFQTELSPLCYLLTLEELEQRVCGDPEIDLDLLKRKTQYKGATVNSNVVKWFWNVMKGLSKEDRQRFIQFAWARSRLPHDMATNNNIKMLLNFTKTSEQALPKAQTCFFLVDMPMYSSEEQMRQKLMQALECDEINS